MIPASNPCAHCPNRDPRDAWKVMQPEGPVHSTIAVLGDKPSYEDAKVNRNFAGIGGDELNRNYLRLAGLSYDQVRAMNSVSCYLGFKEEPSKELAVGCCAHNIHRQLQSMPNLSVIVGMGVGASYLADPNGLDLELEHGCPRAVSLADGRTVWFFPTMHPMAGRHQDRMAPWIWDDFRALGRFLRGSSVWRQPEDENQRTRAEWNTHTAGEWDSLLDSLPFMRLSVDTEWTSEGKLFCAQFAVDPQHGYLIRADDSEGITWFRERVWSRLKSKPIDPYIDPTNQTALVVHNDRADLPEVRRLGLDVPPVWIDTMKMAYHLGYRQSLKMLGYRLGWMRMRSFDDVTDPYYTEDVLNWLMERKVEVGIEQAHREILALVLCTRANQPVTGLTAKGNRSKSKNSESDELLEWVEALEARPKATYNLNARTQKIQRNRAAGWVSRINRIIDDSLLREMEIAFDDRLDKLEEACPDWVVRLLQDRPARTIDRVPLSEIIDYGCDDAMATWRIVDPLWAAQREQENL